MEDIDNKSQQMQIQLDKKCSDLLHEVVPLGGGVQGDHAHAAAGAVAARPAPRQVVAALPAYRSYRVTAATIVAEEF